MNHVQCLEHVSSCCCCCYYYYYPSINPGLYFIFNKSLFTKKVSDFCGGFSLHYAIIGGIYLSTRGDRKVFWEELIRLI